MQDVAAQHEPRHSQQSQEDNGQQQYRPILKEYKNRDPLLTLALWVMATFLVMWILFGIFACADCCTYFLIAHLVVLMLAFFYGYWVLQQEVQTP